MSSDTEPTPKRTEKTAGDEGSPLLHAIRSYKPDQESIMTTKPALDIPRDVTPPTSPTVMVDAQELPTRRASPTPLLTLIKDAAPVPKRTGSTHTQGSSFKSRQSSIDDQQIFTSEDEEEVEFVLESTPVPSEVGVAVGRRPSVSNTALDTPTRPKGKGKGLSNTALFNVPSNSSGGTANEHFGNGVTCRYYNKGSYLEPWDDAEIAKQLDLKLGIRKDTLRATTAMQKADKDKGAKKLSTAKKSEKEKARDQEKKTTKEFQKSNQSSVKPAVASSTKQSRSRNNSVVTVSSQEKKKGDKKNSSIQQKSLQPPSGKDEPVPPGTLNDSPSNAIPSAKARNQTSPGRIANPPLSGGVGLGTSSKLTAMSPGSGLLRMSASSPKESSNLLRTGVAPSRPHSTLKGTIGLGVTQASDDKLDRSGTSEENPAGSDHQGSPPEGPGKKRKPNKRGYAPPYALGGGSTYPPRWDLPQQLDRLQLLRFGHLTLVRGFIQPDNCFNP
ncbi:hypothetical protein FRC17_005862 [Serendipita sp. 399]|nr:hypothetical protein FRC17_005862 [Serendipita sp. 399]